MQMVKVWALLLVSAVKAWDYLFLMHLYQRVRRLQGIKGDKQDVPAVAADLFLHVRSNDGSVTYTVVDQIMEFLRPITSVVDETHGFHYEQRSFPSLIL